MEKKSLGPRTIVFPAPVLIVGSYDAAGRPNAMNAAWGGICCSQPPCVAVSLRAATHSHGCIMRRKAFTISIPSVAHAREADYLGIASGRDADKFAAAGLTPVRSAVVDAPYVGEFPLVLECAVLHVFELGLHTQFVGEIKDCKADAAVLGPGGLPDIARVQPIVYAPGAGVYHAVGAPLGQAHALGKDLGDGRGQPRHE